MAVPVADRARAWRPRALATSLWGVSTQSSSEHARLARAARSIAAQVTTPPRVGLVLGSGLGSCGELLRDARSIDYAQIDGMPRPRVEGHAGRLLLGRIGETPVVAMQGRVHLYEGHSPADVVFGVRLMITLGASTIVLTNACGGIDAGFRPGDLMLVLDHINLTGRNPLCGVHEPELGPRFPAMGDVYDGELRAQAERLGGELGIKLVAGVYAGVLGPSYETPAEIAMLRTLGAHAVGMSTVLEAVAARAMGARCLGLACITNRAAGLPGAILDHAEVQAVAAASATHTKKLLAALLR